MIQAEVGSRRTGWTAGCSESALSPSRWRRKNGDVHAGSTRNIQDRRVGSRGRDLAPSMRVPLSKRYVYILKNDGQPRRYYTGVTSDVGARLVDHNEGRCRHTASGRPWHVDVVVGFADEHRAIAFERYLKSGSGGSFARRHLR